MMNRMMLEKDMYEVFRKAYLNTFNGNICDNKALENVKACADAFADECASKLSKIIDEYIKTADVQLSLSPMQTFNVACTSAVGPVTGTAIGTLQGEIKAGLK